MPIIKSTGQTGMLSPMSIASLSVSFSVLNETLPDLLLNKSLELMAAFCEVDDREAVD